MVASPNGPGPATNSFAEAQAAWPPACRPAATGVLRQVAADFRVDEELGFEPAGSGEHLYLRVRCEERTTAQAQAVLARCFGVAAMDVGYAGMKDRHAVTRQWFSVRAPRLDSAVPDDPRVAIEARVRHERKLRPGEHRANRFAIVVKDARGDWAENLDRLAEQGFPNYFGEQRFGRCGGNIPKALAWVRAGRPPCRRFVRALHISTLRAQIFNDVLGARVQDDSWRTLLDGDPAASEGAACRPTGPLWGRGRSLAAGDHPSIGGRRCSRATLMRPKRWSSPARARLVAPLSQCRKTLSGSRPELTCTSASRCRRVPTRRGFWPRSSLALERKP